jgi:hypothetical protein
LHVFVPWWLDRDVRTFRSSGISELAFFLDDDFVIKMSVHEVSPHSVPVLDVLLTLRALARAGSVLILIM